MSSYLRDSTAFIVATGTMLVLAVASTRWFVSDLAIHRTITRRNILDLLEQRTLPFRGDTSHAILAAVQAIASETTSSPCGGSDNDSPPCDQINSLHKSFSALSGVLLCGGDAAWSDACLQSAARRSYLAMDPKYRPKSMTEWTESVARYKGPFAIVDCPGVGEGVSHVQDVRGPIHEAVYGPAGCDQEGASVLTRLLVPSRTWALFRPFILGHHDDLVCRDMTRVEASNNFSMLMEPLLAAHLASHRHVEVAAGSGAGAADASRGLVPQLVQAYVLSPDSMIRYWDIQNRDAPTVLSHARLWGASPFVQLPLERQEHFETPTQPKRDDIPAVRESAEAMCANIPDAPYIDYGGYGLVRTKCSCALEPGGFLVGVFCTDYTIPILPIAEERPAPIKVSVKIPDEHGAGSPRDVLDIPPNSWLRKIIGWFLVGPSTERNNLLSWATVRIPHDLSTGSSCLKKIAVGDPHHFPAMKDAVSESDVKNVGFREAIAGELCEGVASARDGYFQDIQALYRSSEQGSRAYFVPTGKSGLGLSADHIGLILIPEPRYTPIKGLVFALVWWGMFFVAIVARAYVERSDLARVRDESILRSLPAGVIDVSRGHYIDHANDRAEEVLGTTLRTFGAENDVVDVRDMFDLLEPVFLHLRGSQEEWQSSFHTCKNDVEFQKNLLISTLRDVELDRRSGRVSQYYARLKGTPGREGHQWVSVKGSPLLESSSWVRVEERTFAVVQLVHDPVRMWLERWFETRSNDEDYQRAIKAWHEGRVI
jgi:hypothetical protein